MEQAATGAIRLMLVDDHDSFRQALAFLFDRRPDFKVAAQVGTLAEAQRFLNQQESPKGIEAAVVDLGLPDGNGADFVASLRSRNPSATVLVLSATLSPENFARALEAGASGVLDKLAGLEEIIAAVAHHRAENALPSQREVIEMPRLYVQGRGKSDNARTDMGLVMDQLTPREREILEALAAGSSSKEISESLHLTVKEEGEYVESILDKLGARSRLHALAIAACHSIVEIR